MLELKYDGTTITGTLDGATAIFKEPDRGTGDWTLNVIKNFLDSFGVTYRESGVIYSKNQPQSLHYIDFDGLTVLSRVSIDEDGEQLELVSSPELEAILKALGAL